MKRAAVELARLILYLVLTMLFVVGVAVYGIAPSAMAKMRKGRPR